MYWFTVVERCLAWDSRSCLHLTFWSRPFFVCFALFFSFLFFFVLPVTNLKKQNKASFPLLLSDLLLGSSRTSEWCTWTSCPASWQTSWGIWRMWCFGRNCPFVMLCVHEICLDLDDMIPVYTQHIMHVRMWWQLFCQEVFVGC